MLASRARLRRACTLLAFPAVVPALAAFSTSALAQTRRPQPRTQAPTVFSPASQVGSVSLRAAVVLADHSVKPLPLMPVVVRRNGTADSVSGRTDLDGRLMMTLPVGAYTVRARMWPPVEGRAFSWSIPVTVRRAATSRLELTNANASSDSVAPVIASAPKPTPATPAPPVAAEREPATPPSAPPPSTSSSNERALAERVPRPAPVTLPAEPAPRTAKPRETATARQAELPPYRANTSGFFLGLGLNGSAVTADELGVSNESGGGGTLQLGWGFTRNFALFLEGSGALIAGEINDYTLGHFDVGARWHFVGRTRALVPFVEAAFSGRASVEEDVMLVGGNGSSYQGDLMLSGAGFSLGGGLSYFVSRSWAIGGSLKWTTGEFSRVTVDNVSVDGLEIDATSTRFNLGFSWYPMGGGR